MSAAAARILSLVRMATGAIFLALGYGKVTGQFVRGGFASDARETAAKAWPVWSRFLHSVVIPNASAVGWLIAAGELAVGTALLLGLWTRAASIGGSLLVLAFLLGQFYVPGKPWDGWVTAGLTSKFAILLLLALAAADAGKAWGFDGRPRGPRRR
jgi:uncharacterized membrane protein YphA (DoxX/SURF4 family)